MNIFRLTLSASLALAALSASAQTYHVIDLGSLGQDYSVACRISKNGQITGYTGLPGRGIHAFLYSKGAMHDLGDLGQPESYGYGINSLGQVVGISTTSSNGNRHAFSYTAGDMTDLGTLGGAESEAVGVNSSGVIVGWADPAGSNLSHAFYDEGGQMHDLGTFRGDSSAAIAINDAGQIAGRYYKSNSFEGSFIYSGGVMQDIGSFGGPETITNDMNSSGQIVGYSMFGQQSAHAGQWHAFLYSGGIMHDLGSVPGSPYNDSMAFSINDPGQIVGYFPVSQSDDHAFLYSSGRMVDLNNLLDFSSMGWELQIAEGISNTGQIVGYGVINGRTHGFLAIKTGL